MIDRYAVPISVNMLFARDGLLLFGRRVNTGFEDGRLALPGGWLEAGESLGQACVREAAEELGLELVVSELETVHVQHVLAMSAHIRLFFPVLAWHGEPRNAEPDKCSELVWARVPADLTGQDLSVLMAMSVGLAYSTWPG